MAKQLGVDHKKRSTGMIKASAEGADAETVSHYSAAANKAMASQMKQLMVSGALNSDGTVKKASQVAAQQKAATLPRTRNQAKATPTAKATAPHSIASSSSPNRSQPSGKASGKSGQKTSLATS